MSDVPVIVIRPEPGNSATIAAARAMGLAAYAFPLFRVAATPWDSAAPSHYDALLVGSANVFRHGGAGLARLRHLPVHAVGEATAEAATDAGFTVAEVGSGGLQSVLDRLPGKRLLRLSGLDHIALALPPGTFIDTRVVYAVVPAAIQPNLIARLRRPALVLLHSGEAARHFAAQCDHAELPRSSIALACLAPRIAEMAGPGWKDVQIAAERSDPALLALARQMCENTRFGGAG